jgi:hypothetical protein
MASPGQDQNTRVARLYKRCEVLKFDDGKLGRLEAVSAEGTRYQAALGIMMNSYES